MNKLQKYIPTLLSNARLVVVTLMVALGLFAFAMPSASAATAADCEGISSPAERGACLADPDAYFDDRDGSGVLELAETIINMFSLIIGVIAVIMIIIGGLKYIMSAGDPSNVTSAKNTILYAIVGLVIVAFAQIIVLFVLQETGA